MKAFMKYMLLLILPGLMVGVFSISCTEDELPNSGNPIVYYVRVTDPAKSDSLLVAAFMGDLIAIVGDNLGGVREIWFNDQEAFLTPTYITDQSILVNVPSTPPTEINDKMTMVFADGYTLEYDFRVDIPGPVLASIKSEYVEDGDIAVLNGDYFFDPIVVTFTDGLEAVVDNLEKTKLEVVVPEGASTGPISITTNFGTVTSTFLFRDNRNTILDYDVYTHESWTSPIAYADSMPEIDPCSGNYTYLKHDAVGSWMWTNELTMQYWAPRGIKGNVPVATGSIYDLDFRFEVNIPVEWVEVQMRIFFAPYIEDHGHDNNVHAWWTPWEDGPYTTDGWETISILLTDFNTDNNGNPASIDDLSSLTNLTMMIFGSATGEYPVHICIDNPRIVPR
ncbi:hypothetical protein ES705_06007 [subsurface metagenome]